MSSVVVQLGAGNPACPLVTITITEIAPGQFRFSVVQDTSGSRPIGDLRGLFFDVRTESLVSGCGTQARVTDTDYSGGRGIRDGSRVKVADGNDSVTRVGGGDNNMNGALYHDGRGQERRGYDVGMEFGSAGIGCDDVRNVDFTLKLAGATLNDFLGMDFGVRMTSVGTLGGPRCGSCKLTGVATLGTGGNTAPVAVNDTATVAEDGSVLINVLANDTDADGNPLSIVPGSVTATNGTVVIEGGQIRFIPAADYNGPATISYRVTDGTAQSNVATVTVNVTAVNDAPTAVNDTATVAEDGSILINVLANDTDADGNLLSIVPGSVTATNGTAVIEGLAIRFTAAPDYNGPAIVTYRVSDGSVQSNAATVAITVTAVNDAPVASGDAASVAEDGSILIDVLANDTDADGNPISIVPGSVIATNGTAVIEGGQLRFTPAPDYFGPATISYRVTDGTAQSNIATVTLDVTGVNDGPALAAPIASQSSPEDAAWSFTVPAGTFSDIDDATLTLSATLDDGSPLPGWLDFNAATATFTGTPPTDFDGDLALKVTATDTGGLSASTTFTLDITPVNDAPVVQEHLETIELSENTVNATPQLIAAFSSDAGNPRVSDVDSSSFAGGQLAVRWYVATNVGTQIAPMPYDAQRPQNVLSIQDQGTGPGQIGFDGTTVRFAGLAIGTLSATDNGQAGNDLVVHLNGGATAAAVTALMRAVTYMNTSDTPISSRVLTMQVSDGDGGTSLLETGVIPSNPTGVWVINVRAENDAPVASGDAASVAEDGSVLINVLANDTDADGNPLSIVPGSVTATNGTVVIEGGQIRFIPAADYNGPATISYRVTDGTAESLSAAVTVTVDGVNDAPLIAAIGAGTTNEDAAPVTIDLVQGATDADGDVVSVDAIASVVSSNPARTMAWTLSGNTLTIDPAQFNDLDTGEFETVTVSYTVTDGTATAANTATLIVEGRNDAPLIAVIASGTTNEDAAPVTIDLVQGATDDDGEAVNVGAVTSVVSSNPARTVAWTLAVNSLVIDPSQFNDLPGGFGPGAPPSETITVTYTVTDGTETVINTATLVVEGRNDAPTATPYVSITLDEGGWAPGDLDPGPSLHLFGLSGHVSDPDAGDSVNLLAVRAGNHLPGPVTEIDTTGAYGQLFFGSLTSLSYLVTDNPSLDALRIGESTTDVFTYTVMDGFGSTATSTLSFNIQGRNDAPNALAVIPNFAIAPLGSGMYEGIGGGNEPFDAGIASIQKPGFAFDFAVQLGVAGRQAAFPGTPGSGYLDFDQVDPSYAGSLADFVGGRVTKIVSGLPYEEVIDDIQIVDGKLRIYSHSYDPNELNIAENLATGTLLAGLQGYDPDHHSTLTYEILGGPEIASRFEIVNGNELRLKNGALMDYEGFPSSWTLSLLVRDEYFDGGASAPLGHTTFLRDYTIRLLDVNEAPAAVADTNTHDAVVECGVVPGDALAIGNVVFNDTDPDIFSPETAVVQGIAAGLAGAPLTTGVGSTIEGTYGRLVMSEDGVYIYTLDDARPATQALAEGQVVTDVFTYTMHDKGGLTSTSTLTITITGGNDAPVVTDSVARTNQGTPIEGQLTARDADSGAVLTFTTDLAPSHGTVTIDLDGRYIYTPDAGFSGTDAFTFTVDDGNGGVDTGRVDITVDGSGRANVLYLYSDADVQNEAWGSQQAHPDAVALPNGGHLVVWSVANSAVNGATAGGAFEIWGQRWNADGERDGASFRLNEARNTNQQWPSVDVFPDGSFVAVWESYNQDGAPSFSSGIVGRKFNADGTPATGEFIVNQIVAYNEEQPTVKALPDGGFIVTWTGGNPASSHSQDVFTRVYGPELDGGTGLPTPRTDAVVVNTATTAAATQVAQGQLGENVVVLDQTHVVVVFQDNSGGSSDVRMRIIEPTSAATIAASPPDVRVNTTVIGDQQVASITRLADGDVVIVWQQTRTDGLFIPTRTDIYLQRFNADGSFDGAEAKVNTHDRFEQTTPRVAATPDGGFAVLWQSQAVDGSANNKLSVQKFDALGFKIGPEKIVDADHRLQGMQTPDLIAREDGALVVVWQDQASFGFGGGGRWIGQQIIDEPTDLAAWEPTETDHLVSNLSAVNGLRRPDIVALADGGHLVVWNNVNGDSEGGVITARGIWAQRYDADGNKVGASGVGAGGPFMVSQIFPSVSPGRDNSATAALDDGGFVVVWSSYAQTGEGHYDIWGRKFGANGVATGGEFIVTHAVGNPGAVAAGNQVMPSVLGLAGGGFVVSWDRWDASGFNDNIEFKVYSGAVSGGAPVALTGHVVANTVTAQTLTTEGEFSDPLAGLADGRFVLTWTAPDGAGTTGVFARIFNADGTPAGGPEFRVNTTTNGHESTASVDGLADGGFIVAWRGYVNNAYTVMAQRYDAAGNAVHRDGVTTGADEIRVPSHDRPHDHWYPKVQGLADGGWVVMWQSYGVTGLNNAVNGTYFGQPADGIAGQRFDASGNTVGSQFLMSYDWYGAEQRPAFDVRADGALVVAWLDASGARIEQQIVDDPGDVTYISDLGLPQTVKVLGLWTASARPQTIALNDGGHVTAWFENATPGGTFTNAQVRLQRYGADGQPVGGEVVVNTTAGNQNPGSSAPGLAQNADGTILVTWMYLGGAVQAVHGRLLDADLIALGTGDFRIDMSLPIDSPYMTYATALANGDFAVSWSHWGSNHQDVAVRVIDGAVNSGTGSPDFVSAPALVPTSLTGNQEQRGDFSGARPIIGLEGGRFVVVWNDYGVSSGPDVKARLFEANGAPVGAETVVNTTLAGSQRGASAAALDGGGFVVTWLSAATGENNLRPVFAQRFDGDGQKLGGEIVVNGFDGGSIADARVQGLADGGFVVLWSSNTAGSFYSVQGQRFDAGGEKVDGTFMVSGPNDPRHLYGPSFDVREDGRLVVTWNDGARIETKIVDFGEIQPKDWTGTAGNDSFIGSGYADRIDGGAGDDHLAGGGGADAFHFGAPSEGVDTITDFSPLQDYFEISASGFGGGLTAGGTANLAQGAEVASFTFASTEGWFFFDQTGADAHTLYWDGDGGSGANAEAIAVLQGVTALTPSNLHIV